MTEAHMERVISKSKPLFALLLAELNTSEEVRPLHPLAQSLLREFEDIFSTDIPPGCLLLREIKHQINLLLGTLLSNKPTYMCNRNESKELQ